MARKDQPHYPVQNEIMYAEQAGTGFQIAEVNKGLSGLNRRLYRQNRVYRVKVDLIGDDPKKVDVYALRDTYMLHKAYALAMKEWNESFDNADEVVREENIGRWRDFRVATQAFLGDIALNPQVLAAQGPKVLAGNVVIDEWQNSISFNTAGVSRDFGLYADANTFGILNEYDLKGNVIASPNTATTAAAYGELKSDLHDSEVVNLQTSGNLPPYDSDSSSPFAILEYVGTIYVGANGEQRTSTGYFDAPLGAVYLLGQGSTVSTIFDATSPTDPTKLFKVTVQKGDYKGVAAKEYVDAKSLGA